MFKFNCMRTMICCFALSIAVAGCGKGDGKKESTQVAAKVNGTEISMHQINQAIKATPNVNAENVNTIRGQILEKLIDQQIIVAKADADKLDRSPDVMMAIESAKKDILARAYLQKIVANSVVVSDQEVKKYYQDHPGLFSKRRIYNLQDIGIDKSQNVSVDSITQEIAGQKSMQDIANELKSKEIKFSGGSYSRPAEQIPLEILPELQSRNEGEVVILEVGNAIHIIKILRAQDAPIELAPATPFIKNYFINTRGKKLIDEKMALFRKEAKVEYVGDFANQKTAAKTTDVPVNDAKPNENKQSDKSAIEAGVAGLK